MIHRAFGEINQVCVQSEIFTPNRKLLEYNPHWISVLTDFGTNENPHAKLVTNIR